MGRAKKWMPWLALLVAAGCSTPRNGPLATASRPTAPPATKAARRDLPPQQAADVCCRAAEELERHGRTREALEQYLRARQFQPQRPGTAIHVARLYAQLGDSVQAEKMFAKALEEHPGDAELLNDLGYFRYEQGNLPAAEQTLRQCLELQPNHARAWNNLAVVLAHQDRYDESLAAFSRVVPPAAAHSNLGIILAKRGRPDQARAAFQHSLALDRGLQQPAAFLTFYDRPRGMHPAHPAGQPDLHIAARDGENRPFAAPLR